MCSSFKSIRQRRGSAAPHANLPSVRAPRAANQSAPEGARPEQKSEAVRGKDGRNQTLRKPAARLRAAEDRVRQAARGRARPSPGGGAVFARVTIVDQSSDAWGAVPDDERGPR